MTIRGRGIPGVLVYSDCELSTAPLHIKSRFCVQLLSVLLTLSTALPCIAISSDQDKRSSDMVQKILSSRRDLVNYRCSVEYISTMSYESRKRALEMARESGDFPTEVIKAFEDDLQGSGKKYEMQDVVADATGRIKTSMIVGDYDDAGGRHAVGKTERAWDGVMGILYSDRLQDNYPGGAVITAEKQKDFSLMRLPLRFFGGRFLEALEGASSAGKSIELKQDKADGTWQISFEADDPAFGLKNCIWKCTIDPSKNFSVAKGESARPQGHGFRFAADYKEIRDGIWFPVNGTGEGFYADGINEYITSARITNIVINNPNLGKNAFHVDLPEGTRVRDTVRGISYIVGEPSSLAGKALPTLRNLDPNLDDDQNREKMLLVCFFDMNQRPSRNCITQLAKRAEQLQEKGVTVVAVQASKIDQTALDKWVKKTEVPFQVGIIQGDEEKTRFAWAVRSLPWLILTTRKHIVAAEGFGLAELDGKLTQAGDGK